MDNIYKRKRIYDMKARINRNRSADGLTLEQVMQKYIRPYTPSNWVKNIELMLRCLKPNGGQWMWPNAALEFTRTGEDSFNIRDLA